MSISYDKKEKFTIEGKRFFYLSFLRYTYKPKLKKQSPGLAKP